jgi:RNA-directed DNA polymerase
MRLSHHLIESLFFQFTDLGAAISALQDHVGEDEIQLIKRLAEHDLPPVSSPEVLAVLVGVNPGFVWSLLNRNERYYRTFPIRSGSKTRTITAPRIGLKIIQKWLSFHLGMRTQFADHIYGFVPGRSHLAAANRHIGSEWAYSVDLADFFASTPRGLVFDAYQSLGYESYSADVLARLSCFRNYLAQGAPTSPVLSNICFRQKDLDLVRIASSLNCTLTRYADDIVFSGTGSMPEALPELVLRLFESGPWRLAHHKNLSQPLKGRIKIHGVLVKPDQIRLTKGYRNKIRAYSHVLASKGPAASNYRKLVGHVQYAEYVSRMTDSPSGISSKSAAWRDFYPPIEEPAAEAIGAQASPLENVGARRPFELFKRWFGRLS